MVSHLPVPSIVRTIVVAFFDKVDAKCSLARGVEPFSSSIGHSEETDVVKRKYGQGRECHDAATASVLLFYVVKEAAVKSTTHETIGTNFLTLPLQRENIQNS